MTLYMCERLEEVPSIIIIYNGGYYLLDIYKLLLVLLLLILGWNNDVNMGGKGNGYLLVL